MYKTTIILSIILLLFSVPIYSEEKMEFLKHQKSFETVKTAYDSKDKVIDSLLKKNGMDRNNYKILIQAFKKEQKIKVYASEINSDKFKLLTTYKFTNSSGSIGPKRAAGDRQIPEGIYLLERFNPLSKYYLSLGINYPNKYDMIYANPKTPGGDIFIHGGIFTVGCIPIGNDAIKELYILAIEAKANGQDEIPVHIFPMEFSEKNYNQLLLDYKSDKDKLGIWKDLYELRR